MLLAGKTMIVTGGNTGIGAAVVRAAAAEGANVVIDYVAHPEANDELIAQAQQAGGKAIAVEADVSKPADTQRLVQRAVEEFGRLDVLVNNAGIETRTSVLDSTEADYDKVMAINLKGAFFGTQSAARRFVEQGDGGVVINMSSVHEDWPMPGNAPYCLSKGGMRMLTRTAGVELAHHGVRVVGVAPGAVATPINQATMADPEKLAALNASIPMGRMATPDEIANVVVFLASDKASYITTSTVVVGGGIIQAGVGL